MSRVTVLERIRRASALAIRFWDVALDRQVTSGLQVVACLHGQKKPIALAAPNRSGVYVFAHLPGLREFEFADHDLLGPIPENQLQKYDIHVKDHQQRFLAVSFRLTAPFLGIFPAGEGLASPLPFWGLDLFSQASRKTPAGFAAVYAELRDSGRETPAAYAHFEVETEDGKVHHGIADAAGKAAVYFPYPPVQLPLASSPFSGGPVSLSAHTWPLRCRVYYAPDQQQKLSAFDEPNLKSILEQDQAMVQLRRSGVPVSEIETSIQLNVPAVLRSEGESVLLVAETTSPP